MGTKFMSNFQEIPMENRLFSSMAGLVAGLTQNSVSFLTLSTIKSFFLIKEGVVKVNL
jgi:hypothetical protein